MHIKQGTQRHDGLVYYGKNKKGKDVWVTKEKFDSYREQQKQWRIANKERANELTRNWHKANPEKAKLMRKQWEEKNPEKVKQNQQKRLEKLKQERAGRVFARKEKLKLEKLEKESLKEKRRQERVIKKQEREMLLAMKPKRVLLTEEEKRTRKNERMKLYLQNNPEIKKRRNLNRKLRDKTPEGKLKAKERKKRYYEKNPEKKKEHWRNKRQSKSFKKRKALARARRRKTDPLYAFKHKVCSTINKNLKRNGYTKRSKSLEILGCSWSEFYKHIESQFTEGMNWNNRGFYGWHLDHIIPLASAKTEEDIIRLNHYTNLQPLWAKDNMEKSDFLPCGNKASNLIITEK